MKYKLSAIVLLLFTTNSLWAQESLKDYSSGLTLVIKAFTDWVTAADELAKTDDREKFKSIGIDLYRDIDRTIMAKEQLIRKIKLNKNQKKEYTEEVTEIWNRVESFQNTLKRCDKLAKAIGMDAAKIAQSVSFDMVRKQGLLDDIITTNEADIVKKNELIILRISEGIEMLSLAKTKIDAFIIKMDER